MPNGLVIAKTLLSLAAAAVCVSVSVFAIEATHDLRSGEAQVAGLVSKVDSELDEVHRLTLEAGLTAMEARKASAKESAYLDKWNASLGDTLANVNGVLASSRQTVEDTGADEALVVRSTQETLTSVQGAITKLAPVEANAAIELSALTQTTNALTQSTKDLDARIADPNIAKTVANFQVTSDNAAVISTDGRQVVEKYAHPSKKRMGFWGSIWAAAQVIHKLSPPLF